MNENKEIEEMIKVLDDEQIRIANTVEEFKTLMKKGVTYCHAKAFYNAGYRNCKDKVVLDKEEYHEKQLKSMLYSQMQEENGQLRLENNDLEAENDKLKEEIRQARELKAETIKLAKQETAREILQELKTKAIENGNKNPIMGARVSERDLCEFAEKYGVEVE